MRNWINSAVLLLLTILSFVCFNYIGSHGYSKARWLAFGLPVLLPISTLLIKRRKSSD